MSKGFTPGGTYTMRVKDPKGRPYTNILNNGVGDVAADGSTPSWTWVCALGAGGLVDEPGRYTVQLTDNATGKMVEFYFDIAAP